MKASQMLYGLLLLCALLVAVIAVRLPDGKIWFDAFQPLSTVIIGVAAISLAYQNYALAQKKRQDDLFKLRWEFYIKIPDYAPCSAACILVHIMNIQQLRVGFGDGAQQGSVPERAE